MKRIAVLGSTGSIGKNVLNVARHLKESVQVDAIAAHCNIELLQAQAQEFRPRLVAVFDEKKAMELQKKIPHIEVVAKQEGLIAASTLPQVEMVVSAISGLTGLIPTIKAIEAGKDIALANKEVLVAAGQLITSLVKEKGVQLLPVDSEHSAIFQCLQGNKNRFIRRLVLTASGGPFKNWSKDQLAQVSLQDALAHPTWQMGKKITIDSSTLMNKGLEVIEAYWLFNIPFANIEVVIHPQSIIHSMVEFDDCSTLAQMSQPTMVIPIQYALTYPDRKPTIAAPLDFTKQMALEFSPPDYAKFPCLSLAYESLKKGGTLPCFMNAANEVLVERFLNQEISWNQIAIFLQELMEKHQNRPADSLQTILEVDALARKQAATYQLTDSL